VFVSGGPLSERAWRILQILAVLSLVVGVPACSPGGNAPDDSLTVGVATLEGQWIDPMQARNSLPTAWIRNAVGEGLVRQEVDGSWVPALATGWKISADELTWTFTLREGVLMHDGSHFSANDVKTSIDRVVRESAANPDNWTTYLGGYSTAIEKVVVIDDLTVAVTTNRPYPNLAKDSPVPIATAYYEKVGEEAFAKSPVAAGAFKFLSASANNSITVVRFDQFWDEKRRPNFKTLTMKVVPDESTRVSGLLSGQLDVIQGLSPNSAALLEGADDVKIVPSESASVAYVQMLDNRTEADSPLKNLRVRQALLMAIDREAMAKSLYQGRASVPATPFLTTTLGYDPNLEPYPFDPDQAQRILEEEGAAGLTVELHSYNATSGIPDVGKFVEAITGYWENIGVNVKVDLVDTATYISNLYDANYTGAAVLTSQGNYVSEPSGFIPTFHTRDGIMTPHSDTRYDVLLDNISSAMNDSDRERYASELNELMYDTLYVLPILRLQSTVATGPRVAQFRRQIASPIAEPFWYLEAK